MADLDDLNDSTVNDGFKKVIASTYEYYLSGYIEEPEHYIKWFNEIRHANSNDVVKIYINSRGGCADTALQFMRVLAETDATVICSVEGSCMSAATMIFLCAHIFEVTPHSLFMFHNYSTAIFGKGGEIYDQAIFEREWSKNFLSHIYKDFLTAKEVDSLLDNKDIWLSSEEVISRTKTLIDTRKSSEQGEQHGEEER